MDMMDFLEKLVRRCDRCGSRRISIVKAEEKGGPGFGEGLWGLFVPIGDEHAFAQGIHVLYKCIECKRDGRKVFDGDFVLAAVKAYLAGRRISLEIDD